MRLVCPSCAAQYEVPDDAIPEEGRDVQCGTCGTVWFQEHPEMVQAETAPVPDEPEPTAPESRAIPPEPAAAEIRADAPQLDGLFEGDEEFSDTDFETRDDEVPAVTARERETEPPEMSPVDGDTEAEEAAPAEPEEAAAPARTERPSADLDFDFDTEDDDPSPGAAVAERSEPVAPRFDKSLHSRSPLRPSNRPSWVRETEPEPEEPEDLSAPDTPDEPPAEADEDDFMAAVRTEIELNEAPAKETRAGISRRVRGVETAAVASGIDMDGDAEDLVGIEDLGQSLEPQDLEDLSTPVARTDSGNFSVGFATAVVLFALAYATYTLGPKLAATYPPSAPYLDNYTSTIDETRRLIEEFSANAFGFAEDKLNETSDGS